MIGDSCVIGAMVDGNVCVVSLTVVSRSLMPTKMTGKGLQRVTSRV